MTSSSSVVFLPASGARVDSPSLVCTALGAGQLHQPGEQRGDREDAARGTVSFYCL